MGADEKANQEQREELPLSRAAEHLLEECRMIISAMTEVKITEPEAATLR